MSDEHVEPPPRPRCSGATQTDLLKQPIGQVFQKNGNDYHTGEQVISWLNDVLGEENWSYRIIERWRETDSDECCVVVELTVTIWDHDPNDEGYLKHIVTKQDVGAQQIKRFNSTGLPISIGDDYKAAVTDGLKRCARLIGVGLYLWQKVPQLPYRRSEAEEAARGQAAARKAPAASQGRPAAQQATKSTGPDRQALEDRYNDVLADATNQGFKAGFVSMDVREMTDEQINGFGKRMRQYIDQHSSAAVA